MERLDRWASTPLTLLPIWTRRRDHAVVLALWLAVNPFVFGKPANEHAWSTRAILGEERWVSNRPRDAALVVSALTSAVSVLGVIAARRHRLRPAALAVVAQMSLTLLYWEQMVRYFERERA